MEFAKEKVAEVENNVQYAYICNREVTSNEQQISTHYLKTEFDLEPGTQI